MDKLETEEQKSRLLEGGQVWVSACGKIKREIITPNCRADGDDEIVPYGSPLGHIQLEETVVTERITQQRAFWYWVRRHGAKVVDG